jgi:DNA-binding LacI/PurR family transcriptional regulator
LKRKKTDPPVERGLPESKNLRDGQVTIADLAEFLSLTKGTISAVLNDSPYARSIPQRTKDRILAAAAELNYKPNFLARSLRQKRSFSIGIVVEEIGDPYSSVLISGIESVLSLRKYIFLTVVHRHNPQLLQQYLDTLRVRGVEGIITIDSVLNVAPRLPLVAIPGYSKLPGVHNIVLDHRRAAKMALEHLIRLGHRKIAVFRGQALSADSAERWNSIREVAMELGAPIESGLVVELAGDHASPQPGYEAIQKLRARGAKYTAVFAYNDMSAIGAMQALKDAGLQVPEDVSVVGFDDVREASFYSPALTTVRQPLRRMGEIAAEMIVSQIDGKEGLADNVKVEPEFVIRQSTGLAKSLQINSRKTS